MFFTHFKGGGPAIMSALFNATRTEYHGTLSRCGSSCSCSSLVAAFASLFGASLNCPGRDDFSEPRMTVSCTVKSIVTTTTKTVNMVVYQERSKHMQLTTKEDFELHICARRCRSITGTRTATRSCLIHL